MLTEEQEVLITTKGGRESTIGIITLNRPKALNALTLNMIKQITAILLEWRDNNDIAAVVIRGNGDKAFCAGGDIKSLYYNGLKNPDECMQFFYHEYRLNTLIKHYPKPYIALIHGATMGGGIGVSIHGSHKVSAHNLLFAMPESGIGFFTDVGGSYFLSRCPDQTGLYLALTGDKINCLDASEINLIDTIIESEDYLTSFDNIINDLANTKFNTQTDANQQITELLQKYSLDLNNKLKLSKLYDSLRLKTNIITNKQSISKCFSTNNLQDIFLKLQQEKNNQSQWAQQVLDTLHQKSPTSLLVIHQLIEKAKGLSFNQCMQLEYATAYGYLTNCDLYEGIRALLIDKDKKPIWNNIDINNSLSFNYDDYFANKYSQQLEFIS